MDTPEAPQAQTRTMEVPGTPLVVTVADGGGVLDVGYLVDGDDDGSSEFAAALSAIESLVLAHACAGIDVSSHAYGEGVVTAVEATANHLA